MHAVVHYYNMAFTREIPEPWRSALEKANFTHPVTGVPTVAPLARAAGVPDSTVHNIINGSTKPKPETLAKIAAALGLKPRTVAGWLGQSWGDGSPELPPESSLLTKREWEAVVEMIRCLALAHETAATPAPTPRKRVVRGTRPTTSPQASQANPSPKARRVARKRTQ